jgi:tetratricopeptide (TPR) repeat protein
MRSLSHSIITLLVAGLAAAQSPQFVQPTLKGDRSIAGPNTPPPAEDPASLYVDRHQAALAALKEANKFALARNSDRAINLLLLAVKRDPSFGKPLYNLGVLCSRTERWQDAISFYREAAQVDPSPSMVKLTAEELERVQLLSTFASTPAGRRNSQYDRDFLSALQNSKDVVIALDATARLIKSDPGRWEARALAGVLQAARGKYGDSAASLEAAAALAPDNRRKQLAGAAGMAKDEAKFEELVQEGDADWDKQQYSAAARLYGEAWDINPGRTGVGMQSAIGFLMADEIAEAVQVLRRIRVTDPAEYGLKASKMLAELSVVSAEAKDAASAETSTGATAPVSDVAGQIRDLVGDLSSREMNLVAKPSPALLEDNASFIPIPDSDLTRPEVALLSSESVFERYTINKNAAHSGSDFGANAIGVPGQSDSAGGIRPQ